jgi:hypothetical protein
MTNDELKARVKALLARKPTEADIREKWSAIPFVTPVSAKASKQPEEDAT